MSKRQDYFGRREPWDLIPPTRMRHRTEEPEGPQEKARRVELTLQFEAVLLSHLLGLEILSECGLHPIDAAQRDSLKTHRKMVVRKQRSHKDVPATALDAQRAAFRTLLAATPCSHCEARFECRAPRRRAEGRLN